MRQMLIEEAEGWGGPRLTRRDADAVSWLVEQRAASLSQVATLLGQLGGQGVGDRRARQVVTRWVQFGLVTRWNVWHGEPAVVVPTARAAQMSGLSRWRRPGIGILRHTVAVAGVRLLVAPVGGTRTWISESALRRSLPSGEHLPDGAWFDNDLGTALEVELTPHGRGRVADTMTALLHAHSDGSPRWARVAYLCSPATLTQVTAAADTLPPVERARVFVGPLR
jgi:hypothetical protein